MDPNTYSVIGLYLTLAGLLGTFFYVHLSNWLQSLLRLQAKWQVNKRGTDTEQRSAIRECRFELKGLFNHIPIVVALGISGFIGLLSRDALDMLSEVPGDALAQRLTSILCAFLWLYFLLTLYLLIHGFVLGAIMNHQMKS